MSVNNIPVLKVNKEPEMSYILVRDSKGVFQPCNVKTSAYLGSNQFSQFKTISEDKKDPNRPAEHKIKFVETLEPMNYVCKFCGAKFTQKGALTNHMKVHEKKSFKCHICEIAFSTVQALLLHKKNHFINKDNKSDNMPVRCTVCRKPFVSQTECEKHMRNHTDAINIFKECHRCRIQFLENTTYIKHMQQHSNMDTGSISESSNNYREQNNSDQVKDLKQDGSVKQNKQPKYHFANKERSIPEYECKVCKKRFYTERGYKGCENRHKDKGETEPDRPYLCQYCPKFFELASSLKNHVYIVHNDEKDFESNFIVNDKSKIIRRKTRFECGECNEGFKRRDMFLGHLRRVHGKLANVRYNNIIPLAKNFECSLCSNTFSSLQGLNRHKNYTCPKIENEYECDYCGQKFKSNIALKKHKKYHKKSFPEEKLDRKDDDVHKKQKENEDGEKDYMPSEKMFIAEIIPDEKENNKIDWESQTQFIAKVKQEPFDMFDTVAEVQDCQQKPHDHNFASDKFEVYIDNADSEIDFNFGDVTTVSKEVGSQATEYPDFFTSKINNDGLQTTETADFFTSEIDKIINMLNLFKSYKTDWICNVAEARCKVCYFLEDALDKHNKMHEITGKEKILTTLHAIAENHKQTNDKKYQAKKTTENHGTQTAEPHIRNKLQGFTSSTKQQNVLLNKLNQGIDKKVQCNMPFASENEKKYKYNRMQESVGKERNTLAIQNCGTQNKVIFQSLKHNEDEKQNRGSPHENLKQRGTILDQDNDKEKKYKCDICGDCSMFDEETYVDHFETHKPRSTHPFECTLCSKYFRSEAVLNLHSALHSSAHLQNKLRSLNSFYCAVCNLRFKTKYQLIAHVSLCFNLERNRVSKVCEFIEESIHEKGTKIGSTKEQRLNLSMDECVRPQVENKIALDKPINIMVDDQDYVVVVKKRIERKDKIAQGNTSILKSDTKLTKVYDVQMDSSTKHVKKISKIIVSPTHCVDQYMEEDKSHLELECFDAVDMDSPASNSSNLIHSEELSDDGSKFHSNNLVYKLDMKGKKIVTFDELLQRDHKKFANENCQIKNKYLVHLNSKKPNADPIENSSLTIKHSYSARPMEHSYATNAIEHTFGAELTENSSNEEQIQNQYCPQPPDKPNSSDSELKEYSSGAKPSENSTYEEPIRRHPGKEQAESSSTTESTDNLSIVKPTENLSCKELPEHLSCKEPTEHLSCTEQLENSSGTEQLENSSGIEPVENSSGIEQLENSSGIEPIENSSGTGPVENSPGIKPIENLSGTGPMNMSSGTGPMKMSSGTGQMETSAGTGPMKKSSGTGSMETQSSTGQMETPSSTGQMETPSSTGQMENLPGIDTTENSSDTEKMDVSSDVKPTENSFVTEPMENLFETDTTSNILETDTTKNLLGTDTIENLSDPEYIDPMKDPFDHVNTPSGLLDFTEKKTDEMFNLNVNSFDSPKNRTWCKSDHNYAALEIRTAVDHSYFIKTQNNKRKHDEVDDSLCENKDASNKDYRVSKRKNNYKRSRDTEVLFIDNSFVCGFCDETFGLQENRALSDHLKICMKKEKERKANENKIDEGKLNVDKESLSMEISPSTSKGKGSKKKEKLENMMSKKKEKLENMMKNVQTLSRNLNEMGEKSVNEKGINSLGDRHNDQARTGNNIEQNYNYISTQDEQNFSDYVVRESCDRSSINETIIGPKPIAFVKNINHAGNKECFQISETNYENSEMLALEEKRVTLHGSDFIILSEDLANSLVYSKADGDNENKNVTSLITASLEEKMNANKLTMKFTLKSGLDNTGKTLSTSKFHSDDTMYCNLMLNHHKLLIDKRPVGKEGMQSVHPIISTKHQPVYEEPIRKEVTLSDLSMKEKFLEATEPAEIIDPSVSKHENMTSVNKETSSKELGPNIEPYDFAKIITLPGTNIKAFINPPTVSSGATVFGTNQSLQIKPGTSAMGPNSNLPTNMITSPSTCNICGSIYLNQLYLNLHIAQDHKSY